MNPQFWVSDIQKKRYGTAAIATSLLLIIITGCLFYFHSSGSNTLLVRGKGIQISLNQFEFYKQSIPFTNQIREMEGYETVTLSDEEIIDLLIERALTEQYAEKSGIEVNDQELNERIEIDKQAIIKVGNELPGMRILEERVRITGLTMEQFYDSEEVRDVYRQGIMITSLQNKLMADRTITEPKQFEIFQKNLVSEHKPDLHIDLSLLQ